MLARSLQFYVIHAAPIVGLAAFASVGRAIQLGWETSIPPALSLGLEVVVQGARIAIFLVVLGHGSLETGIERVRQVFDTPEDKRESQFDSIWTAARRHWIDVTASVVVFAAFALVVNVAIAQVAANQSVLAFVSSLGVGIGDEALKTALAFFLKNVTIIPLTIVWMVVGLYGYLASKTD